MTALAVVGLIEDGRSTLDTTGALAARRRSPAGRGRRDRRAPARAPLGHRRLPRRGRRRRDHRLRHAGSGARARLDRGLPRRARRPSDEVRRRERVLVLQRRLRRARAARRARERRAVPRSRRERVCGPPGCRDTAFLRSRRAARRRRARIPRGGRAADERPPPPGARHRRRRHLHDRRRRARAVDARSSPGRIVAGRMGRGDDAPASDADERRRYGLGFWLHAIDRRRDPRGLRRRRVVPVAPRPDERHDLHGDLELERRRVAVAKVLGEPLFG